MEAASEGRLLEEEGDVDDSHYSHTRSDPQPPPPSDPQPFALPSPLLPASPSSLSSFFSSSPSASASAALPAWPTPLASSAVRSQVVIGSAPRPRVPVVSIKPRPQPLPSDTAAQPPPPLPPQPPQPPQLPQPPQPPQPQAPQQPPRPPSPPPSPPAAALPALSPLLSPPSSSPPSPSPPPAPPAAAAPPPASLPLLPPLEVPGGRAQPQPDLLHPLLPPLPSLPSLAVLHVHDEVPPAVDSPEPIGLPHPLNPPPFSPRQHSNSSVGASICPSLSLPETFTLQIRQPSSAHHPLPFSRFLSQLSIDPSCALFDAAESFGKPEALPGPSEIEAIASVPALYPDHATRATIQLPFGLYSSPMSVRGKRQVRDDSDDSSVGVEEEDERKEEWTPVKRERADFGAASDASSVGRSAGEADRHRRPPTGVPQRVRSLKRKAPPAAAVEHRPPSPRILPSPLSPPRSPTTVVQRDERVTVDHCIYSPPPPPWDQLPTAFLTGGQQVGWEELKDRALVKMLIQHGRDYPAVAQGLYRATGYHFHRDHIEFRVRQLLSGWEQTGVPLPPAMRKEGHTEYTLKGVKKSKWAQQQAKMREEEEERRRAPPPPLAPPTPLTPSSPVFVPKVAVTFDFHGMVHDSSLSLQALTSAHSSLFPTLPLVQAFYNAFAADPSFLPFAAALQAASLPETASAFDHSQLLPPMDEEGEWHASTVTRFPFHPSLVLMQDVEGQLVTIAGLRRSGVVVVKEIELVRRVMQEWKERKQAEAMQQQKEERQDEEMQVKVEPLHSQQLKGAGKEEAVNDEDVELMDPTAAAADGVERSAALVHGKAALNCCSHTCKLDDGEHCAARMKMRRSLQRHDANHAIHPNCTEECVAYLCWYAPLKEAEVERERQMQNPIYPLRNRTPAPATPRPTPAAVKAVPPQPAQPAAPSPQPPVVPSSPPAPGPFPSKEKVATSRARGDKAGVELPKPRVSRGVPRFSIKPRPQAMPAPPLPSTTVPSPALPSTEAKPPPRIDESEQKPHPLVKVERAAEERKELPPVTAAAAHASLPSPSPADAPVAVVAPHRGGEEDGGGRVRQTDRRRSPPRRVDPEREHWRGWDSARFGRSSADDAQMPRRPDPHYHRSDVDSSRSSFPPSSSPSPSLYSTERSGSRDGDRPPSYPYSGVGDDSRYARPQRQTSRSCSRSRSPDRRGERWRDDRNRPNRLPREDEAAMKWRHADAAAPTSVRYASHSHSRDCSEERRWGERPRSER